MKNIVPYSTLPPGVRASDLDRPERCPVCDTVRPENETTCPQCGYDYTEQWGET